MTTGGQKYCSHLTIYFAKYPVPIVLQTSVVEIAIVIVLTIIINDDDTDNGKLEFVTTMNNSNDGDRHVRKQFRIVSQFNQIILFTFK